MHCCKISEKLGLIVILLSLFSVSLAISVAKTTCGNDNVNDSSEDVMEGKELAKTNLPISDCGSVHARLLELFIDPPCDTNPCRISRGENITLTSKIWPKKGAKDLTVEVSQVDPTWGYAIKLWPNYSACGQYNISCPVKAKVPIETYINQALRDDLYSVKNIILRVTLLGDNNSVMICKQVPIAIE